MYIVSPPWPHILWLYWGRNDFELVLWPLEWRLVSGWAFAQFLRLIRVLASAWRNLRSLSTHRKILRSFCAKCRGVSPLYVGGNHRRIFLRDKIYFAQGMFRGETRKKSFFLELICMHMAAQRFLRKTVWKYWIWVNLVQGQWMTLTFDIRIGSRTLLLYFVYNFDYNSF